MMSNILIPAQSNLDAIALDTKVNVDTVAMFRELLEKFPNLIIYRPDPDTGECFPCSRTINSIADECNIYELTPPGSDTTLVYAWPSTMIGQHIVYCDEPYFIIGKLNTSGFGIVPHPDLESSLDRAEISFKVVRKIRAHLASKPPIYYM
jgi:hypothetical protein